MHIIIAKISIFSARSSWFTWSFLQAWKNHNSTLTEFQHPSTYQRYNWLMSYWFFGEIPREQKEAVLPAEAGSSLKTLQELKSCRIFLCIGAWYAGVGNPNLVSIIHFTTGDDENLTMLLKIHRPKVVKKRVSSPLTYSACMMTLREDWTNYNPYSPFRILSSSSVLGSGFVCPDWILHLKCSVRMIGFASHHLPPQFGFLHQLQDHY